MHFTVRRILTLCLVCLIGALVLLFSLVLTGSEQALIESSERYRDLASQDVALRITNYLDEAPKTINRFESAVQYRLTDLKNPASLEKELLTLLLANDHLSEATFTYAHRLGYDGTGMLLSEASSTGQVSVVRSHTAGEWICKRTVFLGGRFVSTSVLVTRNQADRPAGGADVAVDPRSHLTFRTAARQDLDGMTIPSDLHWSQLDEQLPAAERRVEVSVQRSIQDPDGEFAGVLRVGLEKSEIDGSVARPIIGQSKDDPHLVFLCDRQGRLITNAGGGDRVVEVEDDLRVAPDRAPPLLRRALQQPFLAQTTAENGVTSGSFSMERALYLCTFRYLPGTTDWIVGVVAPRDFYVGPLLDIRRRILLLSIALIGAISVAGGLVVRSLTRSHAQILRETVKMNAFDFLPTPTRSKLLDIAEILTGLERAKAALRAMKSYVPIELVKQLYADGKEPTLGAEPHALSVLFTDIENFTSIAENLSGSEVAEMLGHYLEVMAHTIQESRGTIDKYIGDSVMAFWNAPEAVPHHEMVACEVVLRCRQKLEELYESSRWGHAVRFNTRFGLHSCTASVGHFGSPERFNYTAVGDGINLASRLEGLNKFYGTNIIASSATYLATREKFDFRLLDRVQVKGKQETMLIYELLGPRRPDGERPAAIVGYESAFAYYEDGRFSEAMKLLQGAQDRPSLALMARCEQLAAHPPSHWNGVFVFDQK